MPTPSSEANLRTMLKLDQYEEQHPTPPIDTEMRTVVIIDGVRWTREAVDAALQAADDETVRDVMSYPVELQWDSNIEDRHIEDGGKWPLFEMVHRHLSAQTWERVRKLCKTAIA